MNRTEALVGLNMVGDIGSRRLKMLLEYFKKPQGIFGASLQELNGACGFSINTANKICSFKKEEIEKEIILAGELGLRIIALGDPGYPYNLEEIYDPPIVLYVKGVLALQDKLSLAIVGSRTASFYGLSSAEKFAYELALRGCTIVSGMARGIDTYAHRGALKAKGRTIAVMGSGFKHIYPPENKSLLEEISASGAVISEFPINAEPLKQNFPRRNRVISGLACGVLVVEASANSGALITADFALEQGRDVFALPGKIDSDNSFGTNGLIKQGAKLVSCLEDITDELSILDNYVPVQSSKKEASAKLDIAQGEALLYNLISHVPVMLDEIIEKSQLHIADISTALLGLQVKKLIKELPGKQFMRV